MLVFGWVVSFEYLGTSKRLQEQQSNPCHVLKLCYHSAHRVAVCTRSRASYLYSVHGTLCCTTSKQSWIKGSNIVSGEVQLSAKKKSLFLVILFNIAQLPSANKK